MAAFLVVLSLFLGSAFADTYKHAVSLSQLDGISCLPGDRDQPDQILFYEIETTPDCIPSNQIGIRFIQGEFATRWKGIYLHRRNDQNSFKFLLETKNSESDLTVLVSQVTLQFDYDICLWKDVDEAIGWGHRNIYWVTDTASLQPGKLYAFRWIRDDVCSEVGREELEV